MKKINFKEIDFKQLAMLHCEKVALGGFVLCLLYFVYQTTQTTVYNVTPEQIAAKTQQVQKKISDAQWSQYVEELNSTPDKPRPELPPTPLPKVVDDFILQPPNLALYGQSTWFSPLVKPDVKRRDIDPRYPVEELAVSYGYGPFAIHDPNFRDDQPFEEAPRPDVRKDDKKGRQQPPRPGEYPGPGPTPRTAAGKGAQRALDQLKAGRRPSPIPGMGPPGGVGPPGGQAGMIRRGPGMEGLPGYPGRGRGGFGSVTVGQGVKVEGRRWIVITGAVPFDKQEKALWDAINATQQNYVRGRDDLQYVGFHVKRAEVSSPTEEVDWDKIPLLAFDKLQSEISNWEENPLELVDETVIDPALNVPLPPLVGRSWEPEEVIHKRIPILKEEDLIKQAEAALEAERAEATKKGEDDLPPGVFRNPVAAQARNEQAYRMNPYQSGPGAAAVRETPYRQFRFFDFEVQPGKSYQYRVRLLLLNPNYALSEKEVEDVKSTKEKYLTTPWSAPSRVVSCPFDSNLLVGPVTARTPSREAEATVMVRQWNHNKGVNAVKKFAQLPRGQVSNFVGQEVKVANPRDESVMDATMDFTTNMLLADFIGGAKLHTRGPKTEPGDVLFVKADGSLVMRSELEDMRDFKNETERAAELESSLEPDTGPNLFPGYPGGDDPLALPKQRSPRGGS